MFDYRQTATFIHASQTPPTSSFCPPRSDLEDAHIHDCTSDGVECAVDCQIIAILVSISVLFDHDGAA